MKVNNSSITKLKLVNFRNHSNFKLNAEGKSFIIYGANGSGKTNVLEAISTLAPGRGFRNASLADLIKFDSYKSNIYSTIKNSQIGEINIDLSIEPNKDNIYKKNYFIDNKQATKQTLIEHYFSCIWLTPQMDNFFLQENSYKRKFIDRLVFLTNKNHLSLLTNHEKLVRERNKILQKYSSIGLSKKISSWLTQLENELAQLAVSIIINRNNFCDSINIFLKNHELYPSEIFMKGEIEDILKIHKYSLPVENILKTKYEQTRFNIYPSLSTDYIKNKSTFTNLGAHKSKFLAYSSNKNIYAEQCSTGEQKMLLISIITSLIEVLINSGKVVPCLLLDEIGVHLDDINLFYVVNKFLQFNAQIFITHTNSDRLRVFENNFSYLQI